MLLGLVVLVLLTLTLIFMSGFLFYLYYKQTLVTQKHLSNQLLMSQKRVARQEVTIQSMVNQLRAMDPMTLMNLQTTTSLPNSGLTEEYVPTDDESEALRRKELVSVGEVASYSDDLTDDLTDLEREILG